MNYNIEVTAFEKSLMEIESIFTKNGALNEHIYSLPPTLKKNWINCHIKIITDRY